MAVSAAGAPLPLLPLQILYMNFVSDVLPCLALGMGRSEETVMRRPPRKRAESLVTRAGWFASSAKGSSSPPALSAPWRWHRWGWGCPPRPLSPFPSLPSALPGCGTSSICAQPAPAGGATITRNPFVWLSIAVGLGLLVAAVYARPERRARHRQPGAPRLGDGTGVLLAAPDCRPANETGAPSLGRALDRPRSLKPGGCCSYSRRKKGPGPLNG